MKKRNILLVALFGVLTLSGCASTPTTNEDDDSTNTGDTNNNPSTEVETEVEEFTDPVLKENMEKVLKGFRMEGNILQARYNVKIDNNGFYYVDKENDEPLETNTYYTNVAFNSGEENAFYKYSYRNIEGTVLPAEGPYTFFEDENGYAYSEVIDYTNEVTRQYDVPSPLTFADNGFYNFFTLLTESDFTLDEDFVAYTRYDLNLDKAGIISNNLLYSLNSNAASLPTEAYIRVDNDQFTSLNIELSPAPSVDNITGQITLITNTIQFTFSDLGQETIEHITKFDETEDSAKVDAALDKFANTSYKMSLTNDYNLTDLTSNASNDYVETSDYYFTGKEIYVHNHEANETASLNKEKDYYLAVNPETSGDQRLYPYAYDEATSSFVIKPEGFYYEDGSIGYALGFCGVYTYQDLLPIISEVSGAFFEYDEKADAYVSKEDQISSLAPCFFINKSPFKINGQSYPYRVTIKLNEDGTLASIASDYAYTNSVDGTQFTGTLTATFSDVGSVSLDNLVK